MPTVLDDATFLSVLRLFRDAGVSRVSPQAFGMACGFGCQPRPLERRDLEGYVSRCEEVAWLQDEVGNDWMVLCLTPD